MAPNPYSADGDSFPDLTGNGGYGSAASPGSGPLEMIQDGDPYSWEIHNIGQGSTAKSHGLFGWILNALLFLWNRFNLVVSLGGTYAYSGVQFALGENLLVHAATNASPIVCTTDTTNGMRNNSSVTIAGATGNTAANGTWRVQVINSTHFALQNSTGNGTYSIDSATAKYASSLWDMMQFLADYVAVISKGQTFSGNQVFQNDVTVNGTLTTNGPFEPNVVQPTQYYGVGFPDQNPLYTGTSGQTWTLGDPGTTVTATTPAPSGQCNQIIGNVLRFSQWGDSGTPAELDVSLLPHSGSDNPQMTIIFDPANQAMGAAGAQMEVWNGSVSGSNGIFCAANNSVSTPGINASGSVTVAWKTGVGWRVLGYSGFAGSTITTCKY